ncbi:hypothetical protein [Pseudonocardia sp. GCM10023141]|uniref:hypothetical protein n=1 Tax=Pseudonocardia sp. GCM10023141 TaxID=3252653 RepID=UPI0036173B36
MQEVELASWVDSVIHGGATRLDRLALGRSRVTYSARTATAGSYILRVDTGEGPMSDTDLTLRREAAVYAAMQGRGVPRRHRTVLPRWGSSGRAAVPRAPQVGGPAGGARPWQVWCGSPIRDARPRGCGG